MNCAGLNLAPSTNGSSHSSVIIVTREQILRTTVCDPETSHFVEMSINRVFRQSGHNVTRSPKLDVSIAPRSKRLMSSKKNVANNGNVSIKVFWDNLQGKVTFR